MSGPADRISAMQLRLGFAHSTAPVTIDLILSGLVVLVEAPHDRLTEVQGLLAQAGTRVEHHVSGGLTFPVGDLARAAKLPEHVVVRTSNDLASLWELATYPPVEGIPATLDPAGPRDLVLRWRSEVRGHMADVVPSAAAALLASDLPFVAGAESWERLRGSTRLPVRAGVARLNLDGFIEIVSSKPQLVEAAPLPGLFRLDDTHFGLALSHYDALVAAAGFSWEGPHPVAERGPTTLPPIPAALSAHATVDLRQLTDQLAATRAAVVVWEPRLGRRILTLAAIAALDAWPALVVTDPAHIWLWRRHVALVGHTSSLGRNDADVRIVTYRDLARGVALSDPAALIFDDPTAGDGALPLVRHACHRLDRVADAYRVAVCSTWPDDDPAAQVGVLSLLRPVEFRDDIDVAWRYPLRPMERAVEHVAAYLTRRKVADPGRDPTEFRRATVRSVSLPDAITDAVVQLLHEADEADDDPAALAELCDLVTVGTTTTTSPKVAAALEAVLEAAAAGRRVAVVTRSQRLAGLLRVMASAYKPVVITSGEPLPAAQVCIVCFSSSICDLRQFDDVVVVDYPWSATALDDAVGTPSGPGPGLVTVVHAAHSIDDRLAVLACLRAEVHSGNHFPDADELDWLLSPND